MTFDAELLKHRDGRTALCLRVRRQLFHILHKPSPDNPIAKYVNYILAAFILINCVAVAVETLPALYEHYKTIFLWLEGGSTALFAVEYIVRLWVCVEQEKLSKPLAGRLKYALQPLSLLDFIVIATFISPIDVRFLRIFRLTRLLRVLRLDDFDRSFQSVAQAVFKRRTMLVVSVSMMLIAIYAQRRFCIWWSTMRSLINSAVFPARSGGR
jgi:voltage-gated potassium channel